ncbi:hypothetical protein L0F63_006579, partial [Massospora cicadina]
CSVYLNFQSRPSYNDITNAFSFKDTESVPTVIVGDNLIKTYCTVEPYLECFENYYKVGYYAFNNFSRAI